MKPDEETVKTVGPIWNELYGGLWHTTHPERLLGILEHGAILSEPKEISDADRWGTSQGPKHYPYVRHIGGVSLFDFHEFDPKNYRTKYPVSSWHTFVPYRRDWGGAVWIEIDRKRASSCFLSGCDLLAKYKSGEELGHNIMPIIEAAYLDALPVAAFGRALFISGMDDQIYDLEIQEFDRSAYEELLNRWRKGIAKNT